MKPVLLALAVTLVCAVYEADRESRVAWQPPLMPALDTGPQEDAYSASDDGDADGAGMLAGPSPLDMRGLPAGKVEFKESTRLFGPGVSRKQQIRV